MTINPKLDLVLERVIDVPPEKVWACWTDAKHLPHWFVPKPWTAGAIDIDVRPGGVCNFVMRSPEGEEFPNTGCYLVVEKPTRLVWTDAMTGDFRPKTETFFTCDLTFTLEGKGTRYKAVARHPSEAIRKKHEEMGFHTGWNTMVDQLVEYAKTI